MRFTRVVWPLGIGIGIALFGLYIWAVIALGPTIVLTSVEQLCGGQSLQAAQHIPQYSRLYEQAWNVHGYRCLLDFDGDAKSASIEFITNDTAQTVVDFYSNTLREQGWSPISGKGNSYNHYWQKKQFWLRLAQSGGTIDFFNDRSLLSKYNAFLTSPGTFDPASEPAIPNSSTHYSGTGIWSILITHDEALPVD